MFDPVVWFPAVRAGSGADVFTERLTVALNRAGVKATISWFPHWTEFAPDVLRWMGAPKGTNIIHANSATAFAFKRDLIPLVVTEHHYILDPAYRPYKTDAQHFYHRALVRHYLGRSYRAADAIATDSLFTATVLADVVGAPVAKTIPLWVDYCKFAPQDNASDHHGNRPFRLLFVGNDSRRKGADLILELAMRLGNNFEIRCTAGLRQQMRAGSRGCIRVLGRLTTQELINEYQHCDAVLVPSRYEGFGYAALEAMACAKPVVGFRCGAIAEVVRDGETALLSPVDDLDALISNCRTLAANRDFGMKLGAAGRERALNVFTERRATEAYIKLYKQLGKGAAS